MTYGRFGKLLPEVARVFRMAKARPPRRVDGLSQMTVTATTTTT